MRPWTPEECARFMGESDDLRARLEAANDRATSSLLALKTAVGERDEATARAEKAEAKLKEQRAFEIAAGERKSVAEVLSQRLVTVEVERDRLRAIVTYDVGGLKAERAERAEAGAAAMRAALEAFANECECFREDAPITDMLRAALSSDAGREMLEALEWARELYRVFSAQKDGNIHALLTGAPALVRGEK